MISRPGVAALALAATAALTSACAPAAEPVPEGGSQLRPEFRDRAGKDGRDPAGRRATAARAGRDGTDDGEDRAAADRPSPSPSPAASPGQQGTPAAEPSGTPADPSVRVADARGDVSGVGAPRYVDLVAATLTRSGGTFRLVVETAAALPRRQADSRTMNVVGFFDTDLDGRGDHEVWATLSDNGWGTSARHPDGASFGPDSGVRVTVSGATLTFTFGSRLVGDPARLQWSVATEHGTYEQVASGTTAQDRAPAGGALFPG